MLVKDLMTPDPVCIAPDLSVAEAAKLMERHRIRHLPVVDTTGRLAGLLTRHALSRVIPGIGAGLTRFEHNYLMSSTEVSEVMITEPASIEEDAAAEEAARVMNVRGISSLLVMRDEELVGIITDTDLFGALLVLMGAQRQGIRVTIHIPDRAGALAGVTVAVAKAGGNLSAVGGWHLKENPLLYGAILKVENLTEQQVVAVIGQVPEVEIVDVRGEEVMRG